jgi:hypothetical protein
MGKGSFKEGFKLGALAQLLLGGIGLGIGVILGVVSRR